VSFEHTRGVKFSDQAYLYGQKRSYTATGIGLIVEYDSRDFIPQPPYGYGTVRTDDGRNVRFPLPGRVRYGTYGRRSAVVVGPDDP